MILRLTLFSLVCALVVAPFRPSAEAQGNARVSVVIARILSYERTLPRRAGESIDVVVVHASRNSASENEANELLRGLTALSRSTVQGLPLRASIAPYSSSTIDTAAAAGADVIIVCSGLEDSLPALSRTARQRRLLTVGLNRQNVVQATSIAVVNEGGQTKIVVNLAHARAEGVQLSAQLLRLAEVI